MPRPENGSVREIIVDYCDEAGLARGIRDALNGRLLTSASFPAGRYGRYEPAVEATSDAAGLESRKGAACA